MEVLKWILWQFFSYNIVSWLAFIVVAFCAGRYGGWRLVPVGHVVIALVIAFLDIHWIQTEMREPGWDGMPDMDGVFYLGVLIRILLINTVLLPVTAIGVLYRRRVRGVNHRVQKG